MTSKIQQYFANNSDGYTTLSASNVINMGIVTQPFRVSGTDILDAWGSTVNMSGSTQGFALTLGGNATSPLTKEECVSLATKLASGAKILQVGTGLSTASGAISGTGKVYKAADGTISMTNLLDAAGCGATNPMVAMQF
jgi:hypothetical protein